jgi:hypothetical protein
MCIAKLCVTMRPCQHRWYLLDQRCAPSSNLSTCDKRLGISGWEVKCEYWPYCYGHSGSEYKLIGVDSLPTATAKKNHVIAEKNCTSTLFGWSNNDVGLAWSEQVFDRCTKETARRGRDYQLFIVDGHSSHLTKDLIDYCHAHRIILGVLPPHSTHTLQPLDVVMFKPLSSAYTKALTIHLQRSLRLVLISKGDFFLLFWKS